MNAPVDPPLTERPPDAENVVLLRTFLAAEGGFVSGQALADTLGISRVSVWNRLRKLETEGLVFEAVRNRGQRLVAGSALLHPDLLQAWVEHLECPVRVFSHPRIDSTSSEAERRLIRGEPPPFAVIANAQTLGRGRLGRRWESAPAGNIYLSLALQPELPLGRMQWLTLWLGIAVARFVETATGLNPRIKWPNDILVNGRKVAGMLTEARIDSDRMRDLIFGIGVNLNADPADFPPELREKATSLAAESGAPQAIHAFAVRLVSAIAGACREYNGGIDPGTLRERWKAYDVLRGKTIQVRQGRAALEGEARGIDAEGQLLVHDGRKLHTVRAGDVSLARIYPQKGT